MDTPTGENPLIVEPTLRERIGRLETGQAIALRRLERIGDRLDDMVAGQSRRDRALVAVTTRLGHIEGGGHHEALQARLDALATRLDDGLTQGRQTGVNLWHLLTLLLGAALAVGGAVLTSRIAG